MFPIKLDKEKNTTTARAQEMLMGEMEEVWKGERSPSVSRIVECEILMTLASYTSRLNVEINGLTDEGALEALKRDSVIHHAWQHYRWRKNGRYVYAPSAELVTAFLATDIPLDRGFLNFPRDTFYISIPDSLEMKVWNKLTGDHPMDGIYVSVADEHLYICSVGRAFPGKPISDNALASCCLPINKKVSVEEWLKEERRNLNTRTIMGENEPRTIEWLRIIHNVALFLENCPSRVTYDPHFGVPEKKLAKSKEIQSKKQREAFLAKYALDVRYTRLGGESRLQASSKEGEGSTLTKRVLVRGHWRRQPYGPGGNNRKIIWVEPFYRGPEEAEGMTTKREHATVVRL